MREEAVVNIAICDDQGEWIELLEGYLTKFRKSHRNIQWEAFNSAEELIAYTEKNKYVYDVLITDIEMNRMNGVELANMVRERDSGVVIFFLTSHDEYMRKCFRSGPLNFWDKPISYNDFETDMERAVKISKNNERVFKFKMKDEYRRVPYKYIVSFKSAGKKIIVHTSKQDYEFYGSFKEYDKIWRNAGFIRANRFDYINVEFIEKLKLQKVFLLNGETVKISPPNLKKIKNMLFEYDCLRIEKEEN